MTMQPPPLPFLPKLEPEDYEDVMKRLEDKAVELDKAAGDQMDDTTTGFWTEMSWRDRLALERGLEPFFVVDLVTGEAMFGPAWQALMIVDQVEAIRLMRDYRQNLEREAKAEGRKLEDWPEPMHGYGREE